MRIPLYKEDTPSSDGRTLTATTWRTGDPYPVLMMVPDPKNPDYSQAHVIGQCYDIAREGGWVVGTVALVLVPESEVRHLAAEADFITSEAASGNTVFRGARLASVVLGERPCWDGMTIGEWLDRPEPEEGER